MAKQERIAVVFAVTAALLGSYGLALAGEPSSLWLWRDILGLL